MEKLYLVDGMTGKKVYCFTRKAKKHSSEYHRKNRMNPISPDGRHYDHELAAIQLDEMNGKFIHIDPSDICDNSFEEIIRQHEEVLKRRMSRFPGRD